MDGHRLGRTRIAIILGLAALALLPGLGGSGRLTYHEAIWAQSGREMLASGSAIIPTLDGRPWLEKPPLGSWLIAGSGWLVGGLDETSARLPSAIGSALLALAVATLTAHRLGPEVGLLAGCLQATAAWAVIRGRLAEVDVTLACLVAWSVVAFDRVRAGDRGRWLWAFFGLIGTMSLAKGIGFGAVLVGSAAVVVLIWDRDRTSSRALIAPGGWALTAALTLAWPAAVLARHPEALRLWFVHIADRLAARPEQFAGEPWWQYAPALLWQVLPWTPLALAALPGSWSRARRDRGGIDRLLWAWAVAPAALVSISSARNAHYLIHALPPWSTWAALGMVRLGARLRTRRDWSPDRVRRGAVATFAAAGLAYAIGFAAIGPKFDRRGAEWAFYATAGRSLPPETPLTLLYDDWDRKPYASPFGPMPHDLAVRLFYLDRPASWRADPDDLLEQPPARPGSPFAVIGRARDLPTLRRLGRVEPIASGPVSRSDRAFVLYRVETEPEPAPIAARARYDPIR